MASSSYPLSTFMEQQASKLFESVIEAKFIDANNNTTDIDHNRIKYIIIEDNYQEFVMPVIYISMALRPDLYQAMLDNEREGKIYLNIKRKNIQSEFSLSRDSIKGLFSYMLSTSNPSYSTEIDDDYTTERSFKTITLALANLELINASRNAFNGLFTDIDINTVITKALENLKVITKAPKYNAKFESLNIPAMNSRRKLLDYIFDLYPFFDTNFIFYMDFSQSYFFELNGEAIPVSIEPTNVVFDIKKVTNEEAYLEGVTERNGSYYIHINPANLNFGKNKTRDKVANQVVNVAEDGNITYANLDLGTPESETKLAFSRGASGNAILSRNIINSNVSSVALSKSNLDAGVFTPNKAYRIANHADSSFNGNYVLIEKKEIIKNSSGNFYNSVELGLKQVGKIDPIYEGESGERPTISANPYSYVSDPDYSTARSVSQDTIATTRNNNTSETTVGSSNNILVNGGNINTQILNARSFSGPYRTVLPVYKGDSLKRIFPRNS